MTKVEKIIFFLIILVIAIFLRLWKLNLIPPGFYYDIAVNGNNALESLETHNFKVFYTDNNGREGMMMWLIAFSFLLFGKSILSIKIIAAIIGVFTIIIFYFLSNEISIYLKDDLKENSEIFPYIATLSLATSFWHINFSRIGFRSILLPLFLCLPFYFLLKGIREKKYFFFAISGFSLGLGLYTYPSFRMVIFVLLISVIFYFLFLKKEKELKFFFKSVLIFSFFAIISSLPFFFYMLNHITDTTQRLSQVSVFSTKNPIKNLTLCFIKTLGMFLISGDLNWRHNISGRPNILPFLGIFLYIGIIIMIYKIKNYFKEKNNKLLIYVFLLSWFFFLLAPGFLTIEGVPHALRTIGVLPVVYLISTIGLLKSIEYFKIKKLSKNIILILFSLILVFFGYYDYFLVWAKSPQIKESFSYDYFRMGEFLNSLPQNIQKYVIVNDGWVSAQILIFIERTKFEKERAFYFTEDQISRIPQDKESIILIMKKDENLMKILQEKFKKSQFEELNGIIFFHIKP
ncbi:MAG: ArnT family glycosyltransferase [Minisyncoccia bacterium]